MRPTVQLLVILAAVVMLTACRSTPDAPQTEQPQQQQTDPQQADAQDTMQEPQDEPMAAVGRTARARMMSPQGEQLGEVTFTQEETGVRVEGELRGLESNGERGMHVHENGQCDPPDFMSAGSHFNPHGTPHGAPDADHAERHVGDFGNVQVDADGTLRISFTDPLITLDETSANYIVGRALIVHMQRDDLQSQPTGDAGGRAACGVIEMAQ